MSKMIVYSKAYYTKNKTKKLIHIDFYNDKNNKTKIIIEDDEDFLYVEIKKKFFKINKVISEFSLKELFVNILYPFFEKQKLNHILIHNICLLLNKDKSFDYRKFNLFMKKNSYFLDHILFLKDSLESLLFISFKNLYSLNKDTDNNMFFYLKKNSSDIAQRFNIDINQIDYKYLITNPDNIIEYIYDLNININKNPKKDLLLTKLLYFL